MNINKSDNIQESLDGGDTLEVLKKIKNNSFFSTEKDYLNYLSLKERYYSSFKDFKNWIKRTLNPQFDNYKEWKNLLIRHGYINEKEEVIYKP